jgi:hypothetical protein
LTGRPRDLASLPGVCRLSGLAANFRGDYDTGRFFEMSILRAPRLALPLLAAVAALAGACRSPDPKQELEVTDLETYWAVDSARGERQFIAPVARFRVRNKGQQPLRSIQVTAGFRRKGEEQIDWGTAFEQIVPAKKPLPAGESVRVMLKSDGRYYSAGEPASFFEHKLFRDALVQLYVRIGSSNWELLAQADVERRIGTRALPQESPAPR